MQEYTLKKAEINGKTLHLSLDGTNVGLAVILDPKRGRFLDINLASKLEPGDKLMIAGMAGDEPYDFLGINTIKTILLKYGEKCYRPFYACKEKVQVSPNVWLPVNLN